MNGHSLLYSRILHEPRIRILSAFYCIIYSALDLEFPGHRMMTIATTVLLTPDAYSTPADEERR
jgi:hypothetical protein